MPPFIIANRWALIQAFALPDTDDNLRMAQVRALLGGQGWFDLVQHRFDPAHGGGNIHWSRLVDLPIAGIILLMKPLVGGADAERIAVAVAPLVAAAAADVLAGADHEAAGPATRPGRCR